MSETTAIIVGAGASAEFNLPTGAELKEDIARILDIRFEHGIKRTSGEGAVCEALRLTNARKDVNQFLPSCHLIRDAMPQAISIDNFIDVHPGDAKIELCGKLAIVFSILRAERNSRLYFETQRRIEKLNLKSLNGTWLPSFFQWLTENCSLEKLRARLSDITFIVFNYDRCIEHYMFNALQNFYQITSTEAAELVSHLNIFHPYGSVGSLPWQRGGEDGVEFGVTLHPRQLLEATTRIRTFTEGTDPSESHITQIRQRLLEAQTIICLGFAYHRLNLDLMYEENSMHSDLGATNYFGTAYGISDSNCEQISREIRSLGGVLADNIHLRNDLTCARLFEEYWRSLRRH